MSLVLQEGKIILVTLVPHHHCHQEDIISIIKKRHYISNHGFFGPAPNMATSILVSYYVCLFNHCRFIHICSIKSIKASKIFFTDLLNNFFSEKLTNIVPMYEMYKGNDYPSSPSLSSIQINLIRT